MVNQLSSLRKVSTVIMGLSLLGLLDSGYLTAHKLFGTPLTCGTSGGCEIVSQSPYSMIFGIPLSLIGMFFYLTMFFGALIYREFELVNVLKAVAVLSIASIITSVWLVGVQLFIIEAVCIYCMISAGISLILVTLGVYILFISHRAKQQTSVPSPLPTATDLE